MQSVVNFVGLGFFGAFLFAESIYRSFFAGTGIHLNWFVLYFGKVIEI
jgi:hypothetical protein